MELTPFHGPPAPVPEVPGIAARTLLGFGSHGEVWLADDLTSGRTVAVKIGHGLPGEAAPAAAERETALLSRIRHPHVVRLHRVVRLPEGELALVLDLAAGGSLASLVAARGPFTPGEASTLLIPLAEALQHLHDRGVVHGDISPGNVLFTAEGRPQLGDLGVARLLGARAETVWSTPGFTDPAVRAGSEPDPRASDVWGLAAVGWFALTGQPPPPDPRATTDVIGDRDLQGLLSSCLAEDPAERPSLTELATGAWQAARPTPIRLVTEVASLGLDAGLPPFSARVTRRAGPAPGTQAPETTPPRRSRGPRSWGRRPAWVVAGLAGAGVALVVLTGLIVHGAGAGQGVGPAGSPVAAPVAETAEPGLRVALERIGAARAAAFSTLSVQMLAAADAPGSTADRADRALVGRLRKAGYRLQGVRYEVSGLRVLTRSEASVVVRASVTTSSHRRVVTGASRRGREGAVVPADGPRPVVFMLVASPGGAGDATSWRVSDVGTAT